MMFHTTTAHPRRVIVHLDAQEAEAYTRADDATRFALRIAFRQQAQAHGANLDATRRAHGMAQRHYTHAEILNPDGTLLVRTMFPRAIKVKGA